MFDIVKKIPTGLPNTKVPDLMLSTQFAKHGVILALITFSISMSLTSLYATKNKYKINSTQVIVLTNIKIYSIEII